MRQEAEAMEGLKLDNTLWETLSGLSPERVSERSLCAYNSNRSCYDIEVLNEMFHVFPGRQTIEKAADRTAALAIELRLMILQYLIDAKSTPLTGKWVTEKEVKNGEMFFRGVHSLETVKKPLEERFGNRPEAFRSVGESLGGRPVSLGDVGMRFQALPRVPVAFVLWVADHEFPAALNILFDSTVERHLALDTLWGMVRVVTRRLMST
jgi:hypothetical protein